MVVHDYFILAVVIIAIVVHVREDIVCLIENQSLVLAEDTVPVSFWQGRGVVSEVRLAHRELALDGNAVL